MNFSNKAIEKNTVPGCAEFLCAFSRRGYRCIAGLCDGVHNTEDVQKDQQDG